MIKKLLFPLVLLFSTSAYAEDNWEQVKESEIIFQSLNALDTASTIYCMKAKNCVEKNPIYGKNVSPETLVASKAAFGVAHWFLMKEIAKEDPDFAKTINYISIGIYGGVVMWNISLNFR